MIHSLYSNPHTSFLSFLVNMILSLKGGGEKCEDIFKYCVNHLETGICMITFMQAFVHSMTGKYLFKIVL